MATEHIEHQDIDANGNAGPARAHDFDYLVFVERPKRVIFRGHHALLLRSEGDAKGKLTGQSRASMA
jgi:hypothetical protein